MLYNIGTILIILSLYPMIKHFHIKAVREAYDAGCERLKNDPVALEMFKSTRWDGR